MKIQGAFSETRGRQGGIGYPPEVAKIGNRWYWILDSERHGGTVCYACSKKRNVATGFRPMRFVQPQPYGSECYRSLVPRLKLRTYPRGRDLGEMSWEDYEGLIKSQYGEPKTIA